MISKRKVAFYTLGCKLNFSETSTLASAFAKEGYERVNSEKPADVYVINTCSVTEQSDKKCRQIIRKFIKNNPNALIAVTGCYAQLKPEELANIEGVDLVVGTDSKGMLLEYLNKIETKQDHATIYSCDINDVNSFFNAYSSGDRTRSFLKVQDGCDYKCSYCTIPAARGKSRNPSIEKLIEEAQKISDSGIKEIILTGVNIGDYGKTTNNTFLELIKALDNVEGIERYRISSIEPNLLTDEIIKFTGESNKFLPHFHIPLQSGSNKILALMRRRYKREVLSSRIDAVRKIMPDTFFGIDVIVGFPGETDEDFSDTYEFINTINPAFLHVFPYSERIGTASVNMDGKLPQYIINERAAKLVTLSNTLQSEFYKKNIGKIARVLFESSRKEGNMFGFTENYIRVQTPYDADLIGRVINVKLTTILENGNFECMAL